MTIQYLHPGHCVPGYYSNMLFYYYNKGKVYPVERCQSIFFCLLMTFKVCKLQSIFVYDLKWYLEFNVCN